MPKPCADLFKVSHRVSSMRPAVRNYGTLRKKFNYGSIEVSPSRSTSCTLRPRPGTAPSRTSARTGLAPGIQSSCPGHLIRINDRYETALPQCLLTRPLTPSAESANHVLSSLDALPVPADYGTLGEKFKHWPDRRPAPHRPQYRPSPGRQLARQSRPDQSPGEDARAAEEITQGQGIRSA